MTEAYDAGNEVSLLTSDGQLGYKVNEWAMFERYVEFCTRFEPKILLSEKNFVNPELGYAGTIDRIMQVQGKRHLVDIKTSNTIYPVYWLQLAAYRRLIEEQGVFVDYVSILWLNSKTRTNGKPGDIQGEGWQMVTKDVMDTVQDANLFEYTRTLWKAQNEQQKPKYATYKLSHIKP